VNPRLPVSVEDAALIRAALQAKVEADANLRAVVRDVCSRSSVREVASVAELSTNTVTRWKRGD